MPLPHATERVASPVDKDREARDGRGLGQGALAVIGSAMWVRYEETRLAARSPRQEGWF
jgi:hypothetical protein